MKKRTGVVVPLSALYTKDCPSCGDFPALKDFADFCVKAQLSIIQLLPVNDTGTQSSPYSGLSAFALHPMYIRISALPEFKGALKGSKAFASAYKKFERDVPYKSRFNYGEVTRSKLRLLHLMYDWVLSSAPAPFKKGEITPSGNTPYEELCKELNRFTRNNKWVIPYAVFKNIKDENMQASWKSWDKALKTVSYREMMLRWNNKAKQASHNFFVWCQLRAHEQFRESADYVRSKGIVLKGDIPILMNEDSVDCWIYPEFFRQDLRAGSPPDADNPLGQNWGFPIYDWPRLEADEFTWWRDRLYTAAQYYDAFRIDHVLGFFRIWAIREDETTAYLGHTIPYADFTRDDLHALGFSDARIKWLSEPHIPTGVIEYITWNHDEAVTFLSKVCDRVNDEELWTFKKGITGDKQLLSVKFSDDERKDRAVRDALLLKWRDRAFIRMSEDRFIKVHSYDVSTAWKSLNDEEKEKLTELFAETEEKDEGFWEKQGLATLGAIVKSSNMIPCAEDLGATLACLPGVLQKLGILSLKVVRWTRDWGGEDEPYIPFDSYPSLSVATTSVHDSPTLRQWWNGEKDSVQAFLDAAGLDDVEAESNFSSEIARMVFAAVAKCRSAFLINPLQDYLFLDDKLYLDNEVNERINIPGTVSDFNWTYRIPCSVDDLSKDETLISGIADIAKIHDAK